VTSVPTRARRGTRRELSFAPKLTTPARRSFDPPSDQRETADRTDGDVCRTNDRNFGIDGDGVLQIFT